MKSVLDSFLEYLSIYLSIGAKIFSIIYFDFYATYNVITFRYSILDVTSYLFSTDYPVDLYNIQAI